MKEQLVRLVAEYKGVDASAVKTGVPFAEMGLDSLDVAELVMQIEDDLGVSLDVSTPHSTLDQLAAYIESRK